MVDLTPIFVGVISLVSVVITVCLIPLLKAKIGKEQMTNLYNAVLIAVNAVEQMAKAGLIDKEARKAKVINYLEEHGYTVDMDTIEMMIESAVQNLPKTLATDYAEDTTTETIENTTEEDVPESETM